MPKGTGYGKMSKKDQSTKGSRTKDPTYGGTMNTNMGGEQYMFGKGKKMGGYGTGKSGTG